MGESLTCPYPDCRKPLPPPGAQRPHPFHCPNCGRLVQVQPAHALAETLDVPEKRTARTLDLPATPPQRLNDPALVTLDLPATPPQRLNGPALVTLDLPPTDSPGPDLPADAKPETLPLDPHTLQPPAVPAADRSPRLPADAPGVIGRYQILDFLGEGGFGRVYLAHDTRLDRKVALKVSRSDRKDDSKRMQLLLDEARAAARFRHPNIVAVFDSGQFRDPQSASQQTLYYIASAFIEGQALDKHLQQLPEGQRLDFRTTAQLVRKVAEALAYAHRRKIVHRDVKPGNIMLDEQGEPLLMDFGLAAQHEEGQAAQQKQKPSGTPPYMAPEQWQGEAVPASDQYSLGCTLFEMLTGELPFAAGSSDHYRYLHETELAPLPRTVNSRVPHDLEAITRKCLEKDPKRRYAGCQELADDLRRFLDGEPVQARPLGMRERLVKWARREPRLAWAMSVAVGLLVMTAVVLAVSDASQRSLNGKLQTANTQLAVSDAAQRSLNGELRTANTQKDEANRNLGETNENLKKETEAKTEALGREKEETRKKQQQLDRAEMLAYTGQITLAQQEWEHGTAAVAWHHLESCQWNLRGWEHRYLYTLFNWNKATLQGHTGWVLSVAFSPDGKRIVSGSFDGTVKVWDADKGRHVGAGR